LAPVPRAGRVVADMYTRLLPVTASLLVVVLALLTLVG
jgi:sorbitol-specific phosphotransferase system component IIC